MYRKPFMFIVIWLGVALARGETAWTPQQFESLRQTIRPQADESLWAAVPWQLNLKEARERAVEEDKPLLLWRSGGGDVLGRT